MAGGQFDRQKTEAILASLGTRVFLMRNVHEDDSVLFQTRWALSYLRGPLTLPQIQKLSARAPASKPAAAVAPASPTAAAQTAGPVEARAGAPSATKPPLPGDIPEFFLRLQHPAAGITYRPMVLGVSKLHFVDAKAGVDAWLPYSHLAPLSDDGRGADWEESSQYGDIKSELDRAPAAGSAFATLPAGATNSKARAGWKQTLEEFINQTITLDLCSCAALRLTSQPGESEGDFHARLTQVLREKRDLEIEKLRARYAPKLQTLQDRLRRAEDKMEREKAQYGQHKIQTAIAFGATLLGAFMGRKVASVGNVTRAASAMKSAGRIGKEKEDVARAGESVEVVQQRMQEMNTQLEQEIDDLTGQCDPASVSIDKTRIRPRKSDISVGNVALVWVPWTQAADGMMERA